MFPDGVRIEQGSGGLDRLVIEAPEGIAHVYLHGGHVTHFQPRGAQPVLFLSKQSQFAGGAPGKAIRGGVPVCFPWFGSKVGDPTAPSHGFARVLPWELGTAIRGPRGRVRASLHLAANASPRRFFPHAFVATLTVTVDVQLE